MDEPKRTSALAGLLVFMEALDHIGIDYGVIGFSDSPVMHKELGVKLDTAGRRVLFDEVSLCIPGGSTADADALQLATNILKDQPEDSSRWIIMVTDGEGNVNTTGKTFVELQKEALDQKIEVLGVGLGEEVTEVIKRYASGMQIDDVEELPSVLSGILEEKLVTQDAYWDSFLTPRHEAHIDERRARGVPAAGFVGAHGVSLSLSKAEYSRLQCEASEEGVGAPGVFTEPRLSGKSGVRKEPEIRLYRYPGTVPEGKRPYPRKD